MKKKLYLICLLLCGMMLVGVMAQNAQNANGNAVSAQSLKTLKGKLTKAQWESVVEGTSDAATDSVFLSVVGGSLAQRYAEAQLAKIQSTGTLSAAQTAKLSRDFQALLTRKGALPNGDTFLDALRLNTSDTAVYGALFRKDIDQKTRFEATMEGRFLAQQNGLSAPARVQLQKILYQKAKEIEVTRLAYMAQSEKGVEEQYTIIQRYDSLTTRFYYSNGVKSPDNYFFYALSIKNLLRLTAAQEEQLIEQGLLLPQLTEKAIANKETDFRPRLYEHQKLVNILTEEQYDVFLVQRNRGDAQFFATRDWKELLQYGVVAPGYSIADSIGTYNSLYRYQLNRCIATDRYTGDIERRQEAHKAIDTTKPQVLNTLATAKKTATGGTSSVPVPAVGTTGNKSATQTTTPPTPSGEDKVYRGTFSW